MKVAQSCLTLCHPMDCSPSGSSVRGILQARILERVAIPFSRGFSNPGIEPRSPALKADSLPSETSGKQIMKTSSKQSRHSFESLARFRVPLNATFPSRSKGLLGIPSNRCCRAYTRGFWDTNSDQRNVTRALDTREGGHQGSIPSRYP